MECIGLYRYAHDPLRGSPYKSFHSKANFAFLQKPEASFGFLLNAKSLLSRLLSVECIGFEPTTPALSRRCSKPTELTLQIILYNTLMEALLPSTRDSALNLPIGIGRANIPIRKAVSRLPCNISKSIKSS